VHDRGEQQRTGVLASQDEVPPGRREPRRSRGVIRAAITRHGMVSPRRNSPVRGVAPTTTPNQRPRISQPSIWTSSPVSSSRHSCQRSSWCTMPARAARWGRAPASRCAAIRTSAGVRTLTLTAWACAALADHRDGPRASQPGPDARHQGSQDTTDCPIWTGLATAPDASRDHGGTARGYRPASVPPALADQRGRHPEQINCPPATPGSSVDLSRKPESWGV
jgi:hypothetical protein